MKTTRVSTMKLSSCYFNYRGLELTDDAGDEVTVDMTDDQIEELYNRVRRKVEENRERNFRLLKEKLEEEQEESNGE